MSIPFRPIQGTEEIIQKQSHQPGFVYFATDSGKIFLDTEEERIAVGGGGVSILYASAVEVKEDLSDFTYMINDEDLDNEDATPRIGDLIINSDGRFFKVLSHKKESHILKCSLIAVSGTGGGGGSGGGGGGGDTGPQVHISLKSTGVAPNAQIYIHEQAQNVEFTANATDDAIITLSYTITSATDAEQTKTFTYTVANNKPHVFDLGSVLFRGLNTLMVTAVGANSGTTTLRYTSINSIVLGLKPSGNFNPLNYAYNSDITFYCIPVGEVSKTLRVYLNDSLVATETYNSTVSEQSVGVTIPKHDHGTYRLRATLSYSTGISEISTEPLEYEVAFVDSTNAAPLIWFNNYPETIVDHDKLSLQFMVYDPANKVETVVRRYVNGEEITTLEDVSYSATEWITWNISSYKLGKNTFSLQCGTTTKEATIFVKEDLVRNLDIVEAGLYLNLDTLDRSNKENKSSRQTWKYGHPDGTETRVKFNNFNWYNNGWVDDAETNNSVLRISNGASIEIPLSVMNKNDLDNSLTFEMRFKLRNVQKYENLIKITATETEDGTVTVEKEVASEQGVWGKYYNNKIGMCLGTQEGFFKGSTAIASGRYKEDKIVTVSFVAEAKTATNAYPLIYMYIDGVMCSIIEYDKSNESFKSGAQAIIVNSEYCDVDLYNVRVYKAALSSSEVVQNYLADLNDPVLYDMNQIVKFENNIPSIDYTLMTTYNATHPDNLLEPYAVLECVDKTEDLLPYVKGGKKKVNVTFVNPTLDKLYNEGKVSDEEYLRGCPSFYAGSAEFDVQGTSSQGYPRRNYKGKFKKATPWTYTDGPLKGKEINKSNTLDDQTYKGYYMDNTYSETTFTWKADYMESSMTHNTGFASFVSTLYDHHPLEDYSKSIDTTNRRTTIYGFPMIVFQKKGKTNEKGEPIYEFIGRYRFNLDKGCNNIIGFEDPTPHPYIDDIEGSHPDFSQVSECWELKHNQGGRVAFSRADFDETNEEGKLTVLDDFEVRYNYYEDSIEDAIDGVGDFAAKSQPERNQYLLQRYANLEKVTEWLVSTDLAPVSGDEYEAQTLPEPVTYGTQTYTHDNRDYRKAKFVNELSKHFNIHYCAIYFIMTEFLIQYDSRGKNLMLASWGPQEKGGDYIWYPIFYDIDTQLGVNNSGVPSWEYYDEPTKQGDFSTADSVLWNNFAECFQETITQTYDKLRKGNLTYEKLNGYYSYDPAYINYKDSKGKEHHSYVMRGNRPINVVNIDQYFKYIAPTFTGYINTNGTISYDEAKRFYCLQGNRDLHRELFLRNRFNFMDSVWLGGTYSITGAKQQFQVRCNANKAGTTSDKYLNVQVPEGYTDRYVQATYPQPLDSNWNWDLVPYLRQYVSLLVDEIYQGAPKIYVGDGKAVTVKPNAELQQAIENVPEKGQQLSYLGGAEYISSLGDISLKYPDEIYLTELKRLKDIHLGSDIEGYSNAGLTKFVLGGGAIDSYGKENPNAKKLLESIVLTGVGAMSGSLDVSGSEKLKEFRALGTNIAGATFANGVQLETVHLPKTVNFIEFIEPTSLTNLLDSADPEMGSDGRPKKHEGTNYNVYPAGLYIEGLTDNTEEKTLIDKYVIVGGKMGYSSYRLLKDLIDAKQAMQKDGSLDTDTYSKSISISLKGVDWTPYRLVAHGETIDPEMKYKKLTENSTLDDYTPGDSWDKDTLNQLIYEVDSEKEAEMGVLSDLSMLDLFLADENLNSKDTNYYQDIVEYDDGRTTYPNITGNLYVNNTSPISEHLIKNHYNKKYPDLNILVKTVTPAYTLKMVEIDPSTNQEKVLETLKYERSGNLPVNEEDITVAPSRLHHDFLGWSLSKDGQEILDAEAWDKLIFTNEKPIYTVYAVFGITSYTATYLDAVSGYSQATSATYGTNFSEPALLPSREDQEAELELKDRLAFRGWTTDGDLENYVMSDAELKKYMVDPTAFTAEKNQTFYALFVMEDATKVPTSDKYFVYDNLGNNTWKISGNPQYQLSGKITLPVTHENQPISTIGDFTNALLATSIFFMPNAQYTTVADRAFYNEAQRNLTTKLTAVYLPETITRIGNEAFKYTVTIKHVSDRVLKDGTTGHIPSKITTIGDDAFRGQLMQDASFLINELPPNLTKLGSGAFYSGGPGIRFTQLPINLAEIPGQAFGYLRNITIKNFGSKSGSEAVTPLKSIGDGAFRNYGENDGLSNKTVTSVYIWDSVQQIGDGAFDSYGIWTEYQYTDADGEQQTAKASNVDVFTPSLEAPWVKRYEDDHGKKTIGFMKRPQEYRGV